VITVMRLTRVSPRQNNLFTTEYHQARGFLSFHMYFIYYDRATAWTARRQHVLWRQEFNSRKGFVVEKIGCVCLTTYVSFVMLPNSHSRVAVPLTCQTVW
jgi:hypothetical protein